MNKYNSKEATITIRGIAESIITPPNDYTWPVSYSTPALGYMVIPNANPNSQILLKSISLCGNFADGLVFKQPYSRFRVQLGTQQLVNADIPTGTVSAPTGSQYITGVLTTFIADLAVGQTMIVDKKQYVVVTILSNTRIIVDRKVITAFAGLPYWRKYPAPLTTATYGPASKTVAVASTVGLAGSNFYRTSSEYFYAMSIGVGNFVAMNYPFYTNAVDPLHSVVAGGLYGPSTPANSGYHIDQLNVPQQIDLYLNPTLSGIEGSDAIALYVIVGANFDTPAFLTKSINTAFATDICHFDVTFDLEYTPQ
jgi:hypothetical protein